jgi:hypothetical protein
MTNSIQGFWTGTIIYGREYRVHPHAELYFDLEIYQQGETITGIAADTRGAGMHPDPAQIVGTFNGKQINFMKCYPTRHYTYIEKPSETIIDPLKPGHQIYYTGIYHPAEDAFYGTWAIFGKRRLFGIIPVRYKNTGTWTMHRKMVDPF